MTSIKIKFRPSTIADHEGTIYYQIIHERKPRQLLSNYHIFIHEWDEKRQMVTTNESDRKYLIQSIHERIRWDIERLSSIIRKLESSGWHYTSDDVIREFERHSKEYTIFNFMESLIAKFKQNNKTRTSETYRSALNSFKKFRNDEDIMLDCLNSDIMEAYEAWHRSRGNTANTISFYTRILRAVYNRAVEEEIIENRNPFKRVYTGVAKTEKRALTLPVIKKIKELDLSMTPALDYARDMFLMSFYLRGMSIIDMAFLRKNDLVNGSVVYRRRKTGQKLTILWTSEMQSILEKYSENASQYLLPIIKNVGINERVCYRNAGYNINRSLKKIAKIINLDFKLTMYVARHSWASAAKTKGIPISVISEGMGHESEATTQIYLASLDTSVVDRANDLIISSI
ncbi:MAG: site-specific integrase [Bacteroides sp.]|nr:site-specific integrase [Bacteroides sp.]